MPNFARFRPHARSRACAECRTPLPGGLTGIGTRQVCAAGALLNLLGPLLEPDPATGVVRPQTTEQRAAFGRVIMLALVTGMAFHGIYSPDPDD